MSVDVCRWSDLFLGKNWSFCWKSDLTAVAEVRCVPTRRVLDTKTPSSTESSRTCCSEVTGDPRWCWEASSLTSASSAYTGWQTVCCWRIVLPSLGPLVGHGWTLQAVWTLLSLLQSLLNAAWIGAFLVCRCLEVVKTANHQQQHPFHPLGRRRVADELRPACWNGAGICNLWTCMDALFLLLIGQIWDRKSVV